MVSCPAVIGSEAEKLKFERFYLAYRGLMFRVARHILDSDQDAEDAVHQSFLKLAEHMELVPEETGPRARALAVTVAERKAIDAWRVLRSHPTEELDENALFYSQPPEPDGTLAGAMAELPPRYREVLLLRFYNGYSNREIGALLSLSSANVGQLIHRAKEKLAEALKERGTDL